MDEHLSMDMPSRGMFLPENGHNHPAKPRLLDEVRNVLRLKHYSIRTEQSYVDWIRRFIYFHNKKHPADMDARHIGSFLTHLAVTQKVASSTQNQALCALVFLYRHVLRKELGQFDDLVFAKRPSKLPVVFTRNEVKGLLLQLGGQGLDHGPAALWCGAAPDGMYPLEGQRHRFRAQANRCAGWQRAQRPGQ